MYKLKTICGKVVKSHNIEVLYDFIIQNESQYQFYIGYKPLSHKDFAKTFLTETRNGIKYAKLEAIINHTTTLT